MMFKKKTLIPGGEDEVCGFPGLPVGGRLLLGGDGQLPHHHHLFLLDPHIFVNIIIKFFKIIVLLTLNDQ